MRTLTRVSSGQPWSRMRACPVRAAESAGSTSSKTADSSSPVASTSTPLFEEISSRRRRRTSARSAGYAGPTDWTSFVEPSTSAKRNVTVPVGSVFTPLSLGASSGIVARILVPPPGGLSTLKLPSRAATRSSSPSRPEPREGSAPPTPSSTTSTTIVSSSSSAATRTCANVAPAYLTTLASASAVT